MSHGRGPHSLTRPSDLSLSQYLTSQSKDFPSQFCLSEAKTGHVSLSLDFSLPPLPHLLQSQTWVLLSDFNSSSIHDLTLNVNFRISSLFPEIT